MEKKNVSNAKNLLTSALVDMSQILLTVEVVDMPWIYWQVTLIDMPLNLLVSR